MPPILHLMRHGQGFHSAEVTKDGHLLRDPHLTEKGKEQCKNQSKAFNRHEKIDLLLASPLRRAIQTCLLTFPSTNTHLPITVHPLASEVSSQPADTGSPPEILRDEFASSNVDFSLLSENWYVHEGELATDPMAVMARARKLRLWIKGRKEREVVLVSHGFFNHFVTGEVDERGEQTTPWWGEAELRTYVFSDDDDEFASMLETEESLARRGAKLADAKEKATASN